MELLNDSKYFDPPNLHEEDGCERCHNHHEAEHFFDDWCGVCNDQKKCGKCQGEGYYSNGKFNDIECEVCQTTGRVWR